jgi:hypothetical protein
LQQTEQFEIQLIHRDAGVHAMNLQNCFVKEIIF